MRNQPTVVTQPISSQRISQETLEDYMKALVSSDISKDDFENKLDEMEEQGKINGRQSR